MWKNSGFTMIEMLLVLVIVLLSTGMLVLRFPESGYKEMLIMKEKILLAHFKSIHEYEISEIILNENQLIIDDSSFTFKQLTCEPNEFHFNSAGNIEHALTLTCQDMKHQYQLIFQLGSGRCRIETE